MKKAYISPLIETMIDISDESILNGSINNGTSAGWGTQGGSASEGGGSTDEKGTEDGIPEISGDPSNLSKDNNFEW